MSFETMTWAVKQKLPAMQKIVLLMLADRASKDTNDCYPSLNRLSFDCGMDKSSVIRQLKKLEELGFIKKKQSRSDFYGNESNTYLLLVDDTEQPASSRKQQGSSRKQQGSSRKQQALLQKETSLVAEKDKPSSTEQITLVAESDTNLSIEPINKPINKPINNIKGSDEKTVVDKFVKPKFEEVKQYAVEINAINFDAAVFVDYYEANGWMVGKHKMKDWRATVRNWLRRGENQANSKPQPASFSGYVPPKPTYNENF